MTLARTLVPYFGRVWLVSGCFSRASANFARGGWKAGGSAALDRWPPFRIDDDHLHALGAHHGPHAAASAVARGAAFDVGDRHARCGRSHLARRADADARDLIAELGELAGHGVVVAQTGKLVGRLDAEPVATHDQPMPLAVAGLPFQHDRLDAERGQGDGGHAAGVALLDAAGKRALGPDRQPARNTGPRCAVRMPGAITSLFSAASGWQVGGTSSATMAEVSPRPPKSRYASPGSSERTVRSDKLTR